MKNYSLLALMFSILMFMIVSCGDNGTNTITPKNKPGQLGGTSWKFIADVNVKTGGMINPFFEEFDFDNISDEYLYGHNYAYSIFFCKLPYKIEEDSRETYAFNYVSYTAEYRRADGEYSIIPNTNQFERHYVYNPNSGGAYYPGLYEYHDTLSIIKSFRISGDSLKLYRTLDSTGNYLLYKKIVDDLPDRPFLP